MDNKQLIEKGKNLLNGKGYGKAFSDFNIVYPTTTENIKETYALFDLKDKNVLTVMSSADHVFCALASGVKKIDAFDINYLAEYYYYFKKALIETYDLEQFKKILLYSIIPIGLIKSSWYLKLRENLYGKYLDFWDEIINYSLKNKYPINNLFFNTTFNPRLINYLNKKSYNKLKETLANSDVSFIHSSIDDLSNNIKSKYDYMFLSNISDYVGIHKMKDISKKKLSKYLNDDGVIVYAYLYYSPLEKMALKSDYTVTATIDVNENDHLLTLKK